MRLRGPTGLAREKPGDVPEVVSGGGAKGVLQTLTAVDRGRAKNGGEPRRVREKNQQTLRFVPLGKELKRGATGQHRPAR